MPLATLVGVTIINGGAVLAYVLELLANSSLIKPGFLLWLFIILLVSQVITAFFLNLHIRLQYGRYLKELKKIMDDLETEE